MNKYKNKKTTIDNVEFASKREALRYKELKLLLRAKEIKDLELQPRFTLQNAFIDCDGKKQRKIEYVADFMYREKGKGRRIVEDCKGFSTEAYKLKKKLLLYNYMNLIFREI